MWPALPGRAASLALAIQYQLRESERMPAPERERLQFEALARLLRHASETVPHYRDRAAYRAVSQRPVLTAEAWRQLPVLTRAGVQEVGSSLTSESVPGDHEPVREDFTSGSTGRPVRFLATAITALLWRAITLREQLWHQRDLSGKFVAIRPDRGQQIPPHGLDLPGWGPSVETVYDTGPCALLSVKQDVAFQAQWVVDQDPDYLLSLPTNLVALADHFRATGTRLPRLKGLCSYGEAVSENVRVACREAWGVELADMYSTQEIGYIALQCPQADHYHVQAETAYVEVLDDQGEPCGPGEVGRVVVTPLHNYAMPLLRYEVGDYAEVGDGCACGRTLEVITRVMGRTRNMLLLPTGERMWPSFPARLWAHLGPIRQLQLVQRQADHIEARVVGPRPLTPEEESEFASVVHATFGYPFRVSFSYSEGIDRTAALKFEDFVSMVEPGVVPGMAGG